ncbi:MAG: hypothetical protein SF097_22110 [Acidobacteriota bacterium]|nr:hypothetical protein [Acidobacteriota bacterium]
MRTYIAVLFLLCLFNSFAGQSNITHQVNGAPKNDNFKPVELPMVVRKGAAIIQIMIGDQGPYNVALATGMNRSTLSWQVKEELGLPLMYTFDPTAQKGNYALASNVKLGELELGKLYVTLGDFNDIRQDLSFPLHGTLGYDFLKHVIVQIDYKNKKLRVFPKSRRNSPTNSSPSSLELKMEVVGEDRKPVIDDVLINGLAFKAMIDTWQNIALSLTPAAVAKLNLETVPEKSKPRIGTIETLQIGIIKLSSPETAFYGKKKGLDHGLGKYGAIIGGGFLQNFSVTFDFPNKRITFE